MEIKLSKDHFIEGEIAPKGSLIKTIKEATWDLEIDDLGDFFAENPATIINIATPTSTAEYSSKLRIMVEDSFMEIKGSNFESMINVFDIDSIKISGRSTFLNMNDGVIFTFTI